MILHSSAFGLQRIRHRRTEEKGIYDVEILDYLTGHWLHAGQIWRRVNLAFLIVGDPEFRDFRTLRSATIRLVSRYLERRPHLWRPASPDPKKVTLAELANAEE